MGWKPVNTNHSIEQVSIIVQFKDDLTEKTLDKIFVPFNDEIQNSGFGQKIRAESIFPQIMQPSINSGIELVDSHKGWLVNRIVENKLIEEFALRRGAFSYTTSEYKRWENLKVKFWHLLDKPISQVLSHNDVSHIKLEYWNKFVFDGQPKEAELSKLLQNLDQILPKTAVSGEVLWHFNIGWFDQVAGYDILVNRNIGVIDQKIGDDIKRVLNLYTLSDFNSIDNDISVDNMKEILEVMHNKSVHTIANIISLEMQKKIGLIIENYQ